MRERKTFTKEFKLEAVRVLDLGEKSGAQIARELGIRRNQLYICGIGDTENLKKKRHTL